MPSFLRSPNSQYMTMLDLASAEEAGVDLYERLDDSELEQLQQQQSDELGKDEVERMHKQHEDWAVYGLPKFLKVGLHRTAHNSKGKLRDLAEQDTSKCCALG